MTILEVQGFTTYVWLILSKMSGENYLKGEKFVRVGIHFFCYTMYFMSISPVDEAEAKKVHDIYYHLCK